MMVSDSSARLNIEFTRLEVEDLISNLKQCISEGYLCYGDPAYSSMKKLINSIKDGCGENYSREDRLLKMAQEIMMQRSKIIELFCKTFYASAIVTCLKLIALDLGTIHE